MKRSFLLALMVVTAVLQLRSQATNGVWSLEKARAWQDKYGWLRGCNFQPSSAINQLEMWQAETFDTATIRRELGWAAGLGFNCMRVFLHHAAWTADTEGFKKRLDTYLKIADGQGIKTIFVFFDDCWNPEYAVGKQPEPKLGVHNSGWVRDPGEVIHRDSAAVFAVLERYVTDVLTAFRSDRRVVLWDVYNEPGNSGYNLRSMPLLRRVFAWSRAVNPAQPLTCGVWNKALVALNAFQLANSDIITYHNYDKPTDHQTAIDSLKTFGRPLVCTEYMARRNNSLFENIMPLLKNNGVGAINWGFVSGKTNTIFAWDTPLPDGKEPPLWFHDIYRRDGTPFREAEIKTIKTLTGKQF